MGVVYSGFDPAIGRAVAIKVIRREESVSAAESTELKLRFAREAAAAGKLSHPNIVTIYQLGEEGGVQYLVMELVNGCSLEKTLSNGQPQDHQMTVSIVAQVADALDYAHGEGIVHRDVKPANILVRPDGKVKITDFGIARIVSQSVTRTGSFLGSPAYMSPEQIRSPKVDGKADQWSLGIIAHEMLCGKMPFAADNGPALMFQIVSVPPPLLHTVNPGVSPRTSEVICKALAKKPGDRFASCREFARKLADSFGTDSESTVTMRPPRLVIVDSVRSTSPEEQAPAPPVLRAGATKRNEKDGLTYVWIPLGTFLMGCSPGDSECFDEEKPAHQVTISEGFWMGQTEVTLEAWQRVMGTNPSRFKGPKLPVESITWEEARSYCEKVGMRLPTEAEWEYAARAGSTGSRYGEIGQIAWYNSNSGGKTHEVGQKQANAWGLHDMLGNVWEWVEDWYAEQYPPGAATDPRGPSSGTLRVLRGGSWGFNSRYTRASGRGGCVPVGRDGLTVGVRCAGN